MNNTISLSKEDVLWSIEEAEPVSVKHWKFGKVEQYLVQRFLPEEINYLVDIYIHNEEGMQLTDTMVAYKVKPVTRTITEWVLDNEE